LLDVGTQQRLFSRQMPKHRQLSLSPGDEVRLCKQVARFRR
jgi:hypothetical protein